MAELFSEFALEILLIAMVAIGGSIMAYFKHLRNQIAIADARTLRLSVAFLHFVRRNDEVHEQNKDAGITPTKISLGDEIENLLKDPKTDML